MPFENILNKTKTYDFWKIEEVGESKCFVSRIGGYFDIMF